MARQPFDIDGLVTRARSGPCFICAMLAGDPDYAHHRIVETDEHVAFLSKYPTLPGYLLVCPKHHVEDLSGDLDEPAYLRLQAMVHRLSRALKQVFDAERIYVLSLGSQQGNSHLHFHVVPLPRGVPYGHQQYHALMAEHGVLELPDDEMASSARQIAVAYHALD